MYKHLLSLVLITFVCTSVFAQSAKSISGVVYDGSTGETLVGVSVIETGTNNGTSTDINGKYTIKVSSKQLSFFYVGYKTAVINVDKSGRYDVKLLSNITLDEIVVVGYGTQRKSDLTGSLSTIRSKDIKDYAVSNVSGLLAGKAAGVYVASSSGQPGDDAIVRVRGLGTVNDNTPLYVVDGQFLDNISSLNPSDIDHIEVLKDASACAIYGSKGSNGVILITTKGGVNGKTVITFDSSIGIKNSYNALDMMNSDQYYNFINEAYSEDSNFQNSMKEKFTNQYKKGYNTDWWKAVTHTGFNQNYNLSIRSGSDKEKSSFSVGYLDDEGAIITTQFKRLSLKLNQEYNLNKYVTVGTIINLAIIKKKDSGSLPSFDFIQKADPFTPVINSQIDKSSENYQYNKYAPTEWSYDPNPVSSLELPTRNNNVCNVFGNVFAKVKIAKGLSYRAQYSFERYHDTFKNFIPIYTSTFSEDNLANMESKYNTETKLTKNSSVISNYIVEQRLNYNLIYGKHNFDAMVAMTYEKNNNEIINAYKRGALGNEDIYQILDAQTTGDATSGSKVSTSMLSYLGRLNYSYDNRYLATISFRADGSSRFSRTNRWGYFPSISLGWRISNEEFFKKLDLENTISSLKLRLGWGENGNQRIDANARHTLIGTNNEEQWYFGSGYSSGYTPTSVGNSDIKWETSKQSNIGLDMSFFRNTLSLSVDGYVKKTSNMLLNNPIPSFGAYPNDPYFNAGDLKNTGIEIVANYHNNIGNDFHYNVGVNISTYKTKVTKLTSDYLSGDVSRTYVDGPIGRFWGYKKIGIFQNQTEIDEYVDVNSSKIQPNAQPGDFKFAKLGESGPLSDDEDRTFIGDPNPDLIYGFNLGFSYKNFDVSMAFQGTLGNDIWNNAKVNLSTVGRQNALSNAYTKAWRKDGDTNAKYPRITSSDTNNNTRASSFYVEDGSYLRLQNVQIGYSIPSHLCEKTKLFSSCRFYASGQNLFTLTKYTGLDPEIGIYNPLNMGVDNTHYPSSRAFVFGINLQF